eukprot:ANDGO_05745.mRNA.1 hypothetical protein
MYSNNSPYSQPAGVNPYGLPQPQQQPQPQPQDHHHHHHQQQQQQQQQQPMSSDIGVATFGILFLVHGHEYHKHKSAGHFDNSTVPQPSALQGWNVDQQWFVDGGNRIAEQIRDHVSHYLRNRAIGAKHQVLFRAGSGNSNGGHLTALKISQTHFRIWGFNDFTDRDFPISGY